MKMKKISAWLTGLLLVTGLAIAGEPGIRSVDLDNLAEATGHASSGQPTAEQLETLAERGYVAVVDLRGPGEDRGLDEVEAVAAAGLAYSPLPIPDAAAVNADNARRLGELLDSFDGPVLVHCGSGNRVGALAALLAAEEGADLDEALEAGRTAGLTRSEGLVREQLEQLEVAETP
jgi:uncharacterized protein (TIGR01244 family)